MNLLARSARMNPVSGAIAIRSCRLSASRSRPVPLPAQPMTKMGPPLAKDAAVYPARVRTPA